jgi:Tfp pilus assembly protein PilF
MRSKWPWLIGLLSVMAPMPAHADEGAEVASASLEEAQTRFRRGLELYEENDFRTALVEFQRAYDLAPSFRILYNIAQVQYQLQDYAGALLSFERYLADGGAQIDGLRRREVEKDIERLRVRVATLEIVVVESGAEIHVDDVLVGVTPLASPVVVSAGRRRISARLDGHVAVTRVVDVAGGDTLSLVFDMVESKSPAETLVAVEEPATAVVLEPAPAVVMAPEPPLDDERAVPWVGWAVTGALAAGATVTGVLALRASGDLEDKRSTADVGRTALDDASRETKRWAIATDVLMAGALVAGGLSLYWTLQPERGAQSSDTAVRWHVGPASMGLIGAF